MARTAKKSKAAKVEAPVVTDETNDVEETEEAEASGKASGIERVINRDGVQTNWKAFAEFVQEHGGPKINPKHVGIVITGYKFYQRSEAAVSAREQDAAAKEELKAEREAAREARAAERARVQQERAERRAEREAAATEKAAKSKKTAAAASKPAAKAAKATPSAKAGKATAKKAAVKKGGAKKAAF